MPPNPAVHGYSTDEGEPPDVVGSDSESGDESDDEGAFDNVINHNSAFRYGNAYLPYNRLHALSAAADDLSLKAAPSGSSTPPELQAEGARLAVSAARARCALPEIKLDDVSDGNLSPVVVDVNGLKELENPRWLPDDETTAYVNRPANTIRASKSASNQLRAFNLSCNNSEEWIEDMETTAFCDLLACFLKRARKSDGSEYKPKSLKTLALNVVRFRNDFYQMMHLKTGDLAWSEILVFNKTDPRMLRARVELDNHMRRWVFSHTVFLFFFGLRYIAAI